jgi:prepilin-type processing-associated H-X9-DG protein
MPTPTPSPDDETLFGYLLNALPNEEIRMIDELRQVDASLEQRISDLRTLVDPLRDEAKVSFEPHSDLVSKTLGLVSDANFDDGVDECLGPIRSESSSHESRSILSSSAPASKSGFSSVWEAAHRKVKLAWIDSLVLVAAGVVVMCLLLPSVWHTREEARRFACSNNLRQLGESMHRYAETNRDGHFPTIDLEGPLSFAGVYVVKLQDAHLLGSAQWLWCPSRRMTSWDASIPTTGQMLASNPIVVDSWRRTVGGSYAYNLGVVADGVYQAPRSRSSVVPLLGDMLIEAELSDASGPGVHGSRLTNILFGDGHVQTVRIPSIDDQDVDHPYLNRSKIQAAGENGLDYCLGPSFVSPLSGLMNR